MGLIWDPAVLLCYSRTCDPAVLLCYSRTFVPAVILCYIGTRAAVWRLGRLKHILCEEEPIINRYGYKIYYKIPPGSGESRATHDEQSTTEQVSVLSRVFRCGKICKNERGLKKHQTKMKCSQPTSNLQHTGQPGETEESPGQESNHSLQNLQASDEEGGRNSIADVLEETRHHRESEDTWGTRWPAHYTCAETDWSWKPDPTPKESQRKTDARRR